MEGRADFAAEWELLEQETQDDMASSIFRNRQEPDFIMVLSRARSAGGRLDHVQVLATAMIGLGE